MGRPKDAVFDLGICPVCGKRCYASRREAKRAARAIFPGDRMRAYPCGDFWHFGHNRKGYNCQAVRDV